MSIIGLNSIYIQYIYDMSRFSGERFVIIINIYIYIFYLFAISLI